MLSRTSPHHHSTINSLDGDDRRSSPVLGHRLLPVLLCGSLRVGCCHGDNLGGPEQKDCSFGRAGDGDPTAEEEDGEVIRDGRVGQPGH